MQMMRVWRVVCSEIFAGQRCSSETESFISMCEALGLIPPIQKWKRNKEVIKLLYCNIYMLLPAQQSFFYPLPWASCTLSELGFVLQTWFSNCVWLAFTYPYEHVSPLLALLIPKLPWQETVASFQQGQSPWERSSWDSRAANVCPF